MPYLIHYYYLIHYGIFFANNYGTVSTQTRVYRFGRPWAMAITATLQCLQPPQDMNTTFPHPQSRRQYLCRLLEVTFGDNLLISYLAKVQDNGMVS